MDADRCISCGAIIPEGRMVCPDCERENAEAKKQWASIINAGVRFGIYPPEARDALIEVWDCIKRMPKPSDCPSDCRWHGRHQKCNYCRRNASLKDCYERKID